MSRGRNTSIDNTLPDPAVIYGPDDEDYMTDAERAEIDALFTRAGRQDFDSEEEQKSYLRLVDHFEHPERRPMTTGQIVLLGVGAAAAGAVVGYIWREHRRVKAYEEKHGHVGGLDLLGADDLDSTDERPITVNDDDDDEAA